MGTAEKLGESCVHTHVNASTNKKTILVVEDNAELLDLNRIILELDNYEVFTARSGSEALSALSQIETPDLILLDMQMEDMSGSEFLLKLEETRPEIVENVPVIFVTGMDVVPASKATGFIRKPIDIDKFLEAVRRFIKMGVGTARILHWEKQ